MLHELKEIKRSASVPGNLNELAGNDTVKRDFLPRGDDDWQKEIEGASSSKTRDYTRKEIDKKNKKIEVSSSAPVIEGSVANGNGFDRQSVMMLRELSATRHALEQAQNRPAQLSDEQLQRIEEGAANRVLEELRNQQNTLGHRLNTTGNSVASYFGAVTGVITVAGFVYTRWPDLIPKG